MIKTDIPIYLASKSPRRQKLLRQINLDFKVITVDVDESLLINESPVKTVKRLASEKLKKAKEKIKEGIIITADTIVVLNKEILGKPVNEKDAFKILMKLSGKTHIVYTGFAISNLQKEETIID